MMIPVVRAFFLSSLIAFLGTHARTLPEDILKMSFSGHGQASILGRPAAPSEHPSPQVDPPHHYEISNCRGTGNCPNMITRPTKAPPPPPLPHVGPPNIHTSAYQEWTSIFAKHEKPPPSHPSPQVAPGHVQGELTSISYVTTGRPHEEIIKREHLLSPPPTPHVAPPHVQTSEVPTVSQKLHAYSDHELEKFKCLSLFQTSIF